MPKLIAIPVTPANARALAAIVDVTASTIYSHFAVILPAMMTSITGFNGVSTIVGTDPDTDATIAGPLGQAFRDLVLAIRGAGVSTLLVVRFRRAFQTCVSDRWNRRHASTLCGGCWLFSLASSLCALSLGIAVCWRRCATVWIVPTCPCG